MHSERRDAAIAKVRALGPAFAERAPAHDRDASFPFENFADLRGAGLLSLCVPERFGGEGASFADYMHVAATIGSYCPTTALTYNMHSQTVLWTGIVADDLAMTPEQRSGLDERRGRLYAGIVEHGNLHSQPLSEGIAPGEAAGVGTVATPVEGGWRVTGRKIFASLAGAASAYSLTVREPGDDTIRFVSIVAGAPGVEVVGEWDPLGMRGTDSRTLVFTDVFVPHADELLPPGVFEQLSTRWPHVYLTLTPAYLGLTRAVIEQTRAYLAVPNAGGGMSRREVRRKFDEIVDFAEVDRFIDTPVKHYSTGMYLRLAFAVAAHLEPETLLVDEVLAVGDVAFQKKCIGKMGDVARTGRTVVFVSHNMGAVRSLCRKGLVMHGGRMVEYADVGRAIETYYRLTTEAKREVNSAPASGFGFGDVRLLDREGSTIGQSEGFEVGTTLHLGAQVSGFSVICLLEDANQRAVFHLRRESSELAASSRWEGAYDVRIKLPSLWLEPGMYSLHFKVLLRGELASSRYVSDTLNLDFGGDSSGNNSALVPRADWVLEPVQQAAVLGR